jgi:hypothetical protein
MSRGHPTTTVISLVNKFKSELGDRRIPRSGRLPREWMVGDFMVAAKRLYGHIRVCSQVDNDYFQREWDSLMEKRP